MDWEGGEWGLNGCHGWRGGIGIEGRGNGHRIETELVASGLGGHLGGSWAYKHTENLVH